MPERVRLTIDLRHPIQAEFDALAAQLRALVSETGLPARLEEIWHSPAVRFDPDSVSAVRAAVAARGYPSHEMVSGAGHDSVYVARVAPTAMIFVPCKDGLSHNEAESAPPQDLTAGVNVLLDAVLLS